MTRHFSPPAPDTTAVSAMLIDAVRCWQEARDSGESIQPCLSRTLAEHECTMLAPVLDSLCRFIEVALGRRMEVGAAQLLSDDEHLLLDLLDEPEPRVICLDERKDMARLLDGAIRSTRIMIAMTVIPRSAGEPAFVPPAGANRVSGWGVLQHRDHRHDKRASA